MNNAPVDNELTPFSSEADVTRILLARNVKLRYSIGVDPNDPGYRYADDHHFARFVLASINTLEDAERLCATLDRDHANTESPTTTCAKAAQIRQWLSNPFWQATPDRIRSAVAVARRRACWCHERYSFALRKEYRFEIH